MTNKRILIIGGSSGIGLAVAEQAHSRGAHIIAASRNATARFSKLPEKSIEACDVDITSPKGPARLFQEIGTIDHLVITVKPEVRSAPFLSTDINEAKKAFETKFWGPYQLLQEARSHISEAGSITLTSGIAGEKIYKGASTMTLINSTTEALCRILALELAPVRVNVVSPGFVAPKPEAGQELARQFPAKRLASREEIASAYITLMENPYVTGTVMVVDGGARLL